MSSVQRFIKQITPGLNVIALPTSSTAIYEFVPSAGNYVGNYTPGVMVACDATNTPALYQYLNATGLYNTAAVNTGVAAVARDMGKTVYAPVYVGTVSTAPTAATSALYSHHFRQIQILRPSVGNADGASGVQGSYNVPDGNTDYLTVYIPTSVVFGGNLVSSTHVVVGGQM